jgi:hypothetical protein
MGVFIVLVLGLFVGLAVMGIYELVALTTRKVPTITEMVQVIIWHFVPNQQKKWAETFEERKAREP